MVFSFQMVISPMLESVRSPSEGKFPTIRSMAREEIHFPAMGVPCEIADASGARNASTDETIS
jgi:hypothetical protein